MKKITRRNFLVASGLAFSASALAACGNKASTSTSASGESDDNTGENEGLGSFTYWLPMHTTTSKVCTDHNQHPAAVRIEEQTGVAVDYLTPTIGQETEQMNLLLGGGGTLPDMMRYNFMTKYNGGIAAAIKENVVADVTAIIEQHAPNFMAILNNDPDILRGAYSDDGVITYFGATIADAEMRSHRLQGPMINTTLLKKAGLDMPVTIADWEEMLAAFKDMGVKIPFTFGANNNFLEDGNHGAFSGAFGVPMGPQFFNENGTVKFAALEAGYKDFVTLFAKWYKNGWLDPDFLSKKITGEVQSDFQAGIVGAAIIHTNNSISSPLVSVAQGNEENIAVGAPYPVLNEGDTVHFSQRVKIFNQDPCFVSVDAKNPVEIVEWVDYLYSEEGRNELSWGVMGDDRYEDTYYIDEDGEYQYTDYVMNNPDGVAKGNMMRFTMMRDMQTTWEWSSQSKMYDDERHLANFAAWDSAQTDYCMPQCMTLTAEESKEYSGIMSEISTFVTEKTAKYIMGIESLDTYDTFLSTLEEMNVARTIEIQQAALERYLAR